MDLLYHLRKWIEYLLLNFLPPFRSSRFSVSQFVGLTLTTSRLKIAAFRTSITLPRDVSHVQFKLVRLDVVKALRFDERIHS